MKKKLKISIVFFLLLLLALIRFCSEISSDSGLHSHNITSSFIKEDNFPIQCIGESQTQTCQTSYPTRHDIGHDLVQPSCPTYFRWIYEDLRPWRKVTITKEMLNRLESTYATSHVWIIDGKAYMKHLKQSSHTREVYSIWGLLQLLRIYPGRLPDLEFLLHYGDFPKVKRKVYEERGETPPPLFAYCSDVCSFDIVFPDWSFWGWDEVNIRPWKSVLKDIKEGNKRTKWEDRVPYGFWKGNPDMGSARADLFRCSISDKHDWNSLLYNLNWNKETEEEYRHSDLSDQCAHRYKIYIEGKSWSVSNKFILACDSMALYIKTHYHDFFGRSLVPLKHYWPIRENNKCTSLKFAVDWGNNHPTKAKRIGEDGGRFIHEEMEMGFVYDYMFHLLSEYSKLLSFKPEVPDGAVELCPERMVCSKQGKKRKFMLESLVVTPSNRIPCAMPPSPFGAQQLQELIERNTNITRQVESWENQYWRSN